MKTPNGMRALGVSQVLDYLATDPDIDTTRAAEDEWADPKDSTWSCEAQPVFQLYAFKTELSKEIPRLKNRWFLYHWTFTIAVESTI